MSELAREKARTLHYRKAIVKDLNYDTMVEKLWDMEEECTEVQYYVDSDDETLINALDGDEDAAYEFKMMFAELSAECEQMILDLKDCYVSEYFNEFFVAIGGGDVANGLLGWDTYEHDYYGIDIFYNEDAVKYARKKLERLTKSELLLCAQSCMKILFAYIGLQHRYDCLKACMDILKEQNTGNLKLVKQIDQVYEQAESVGFYPYSDIAKTYEKLLETMPQEAWL